MRKRGKKEEIKKILIIKQRNIGDVLLAVPVIKALRKAFPKAYLAMVVNSGTEEMVSENPHLNEVIVFDQRLKDLPLFLKIKRQFQFVFKIRQKRFDLALNLTEGDRGAILTFLSGARYRVGYDPRGKGIWGKKYLFTHLVKNSNPRAHMVEQNLEAVRILEIEAEEKEVNLYFSEEDKRYIQNLLQKEGIKEGDFLVQIHPTSRWLFKCWPDQALAETIDYLQGEKGVKVILTSGPSPLELTKIQGIIAQTRFPPFNLAGKTNLKQLAALSERCNLFLGIDSAALHIAAAVGTPVIALFGPSGEFNWGPWGEGHIVISKDWECRPCGKDGCEGSKRSKCLEAISSEEVKKILEQKLAQISNV